MSLQSILTLNLLLFNLSHGWGLFGVVCFDRVEGYRGTSLWEGEGVSCRGTLGGGLGLKQWGSGGLGFGGKWIGPSKSSQSLSIAHKWAVVID
ncbi:hypothetical protein Tco_0309315 [Tanacetum coccineum]